VQNKHKHIEQQTNHLDTGPKQTSTQKNKNKNIINTSKFTAQNSNFFKYIYFINHIYFKQNKRKHAGKQIK
jgi:hypothetical protein